MRQPRIGIGPFVSQVHRYPRASGGLPLSKSGLTSAPRLPQARQTNRDPMSRSRTSSAHRSPFKATLWLPP